MKRCHFLVHGSPLPASKLIAGSLSYCVANTAFYHTNGDRRKGKHQLASVVLVVLLAVLLLLLVLLAVLLLQITFCSCSCLCYCCSLGFSIPIDMFTFISNHCIAVNEILKGLAGTVDHSIICGLTVSQCLPLDLYTHFECRRQVDCRKLLIFNLWLRVWQPPKQSGKHYGCAKLIGDESSRTSEHSWRPSRYTPTTKQL